MPLIRIDLHIHDDRETRGAIEDLTAFITKELRKMSAELDTLTAEVAENTTVTQSAITLLAGLSDQILDLKDDPAALAALAAELDTNSKALAAAVSANTPATPAPGDDTTSGGAGNDTLGG